MVAFYNDCITQSEIIGFHVGFSISVLLYCSLGFGVTLPSAKGVIRRGRRFLMVRLNRIVAGCTPVVQCGVVR